jgi:hypothetical protein
MKYLRSASLAMVGGGAVLILLSFSAGFEPIPLVAGILLLWSGVVKLIVLRIWRYTLAAAPASQPSADHPPESARSRRA